MGNKIVRCKHQSRGRTDTSLSSTHLTTFTSSSVPQEEEDGCWRGVRISKWKHETTAAGARKRHPCRRHQPQCDPGHGACVLDVQWGRWWRWRRQRFSLPPQKEQSFRFICPHFRHNFNHVDASVCEVYGQATARTIDGSGYCSPPHEASMHPFIAPAAYIFVFVCARSCDFLLALFIKRPLWKGGQSLNRNYYGVAGALFSGRFIEERARRDLHDLTVVGIRVSGSIATDVVTVDKFRDVLIEIKQNSSEVYNVEWDVQRPTGSFWLEDDEGSTSSYSGVRSSGVLTQKSYSKILHF